MNAATVNGFSDLLFGLPPADPYVILCLQKGQGNDYTLWAYKSDQAWRNVAPIPLTQTDLFVVTADANFFMSGYPQHAGGYVYFMLVRMASTMPVAQRNKILVEAAQKHDRLLAVTPQAEVVALLQSVPDAVPTISVMYTINFKERLYTLQSFRPYYQEPVERSLLLDPLGFEMALRVTGWRMADPPLHMKDHVYCALLVRGDAPERYLLSSTTDLQSYQKREEGFSNRFRRQVGSPVMAG